jgi:hypothetical protein
LLIISADLGRYYFKFTPFSPSHLDFPVTPVIEYLKSNNHNFRIDREKGPVFPPNSLVTYGLSTPSGYDPMTLYNNAIFYDSFYNLKPDSTPGDKPVITRYSELTSYLSPGLDLYGVKFLAVLKRDEKGQIRPWGEIIHPGFLNPKFRSVFSDGATVVLENSKVLPRAVLYTDYLVEPDPDKTLALLKSGYDFNRRVIVNQNPKNISPQPGLASAATITKYTGNLVEVLTETKNPAILVLTDTAYPGWQVFVDGRRTNLFSAFTVFRGTAVPAGNHQVTFKYLPLSFLIGMGITLMSLMLIFLLSNGLRLKSKSQ